MAITRGVYNIEMYRGDNPVYQFVMSDVNEETGLSSPIDISDWELLGQIRPTATSLTVLMTIPIVVVDAANGIFQFQLTTTESTELDFVTGVYDIQLKIEGEAGDGSDDQVLTFLTGTFNLIEEVSRIDPPPTPFGIASTSKSKRQSGAFKQAVMAGQRAKEAKLRKRGR